MQHNVNQKLVLRLQLKLLCCILEHIEKIYIYTFVVPPINMNMSNKLKLLSTNTQFELLMQKTFVPSYHVTLGIFNNVPFSTSKTRSLLIM